MNLLDTHPSKIPSSNKNLNRWKSWKGNTMFAPQFDIPIYTDKYSEELSDNLVRVIEKREAGFKIKDDIESISFFKQIVVIKKKSDNFLIK